MTKQKIKSTNIRITCATCKKSKASDQFSKKGKGLNQQCKNCISEYMKKYYKKNSNKIKERIKKYKVNNKDKVKAYHKKYYLV